MEYLKTAAGEEFGAFVVWPGGEPRGCIIVLHEAFGVTPHIERVCERVAAEGYVAIAPAMLAFASGNRDGEVLAQDKTGLDRGRDLIMATSLEHVVGCVKACVDWANGEGLRSAVLGFCWGGSCAYLTAAKLPELVASSAFYGGKLWEIVASMQAKCPRIVHLATLDRYIPLQETIDAFAKHDPEAKVYVYEADHGFNRDDGKTFDPVAAGLAWARTLELFEKSFA